MSGGASRRNLVLARAAIAKKYAERKAAPPFGLSKVSPTGTQSIGITKRPATKDDLEYIKELVRELNKLVREIKFPGLKITHLNGSEVFFPLKGSFTEEF